MRTRQAQSGYVEIKVVTWNKDSHGLFDYESSILTQKRFTIAQSSKFYRSPESCEVQHVEANTRSQDLSLDDSNLLLQIQKASTNNPEDKFVIQIQKVDNIQKELASEFCTQGPLNNVYLIIRAIKDHTGTQKGYTLQLGDIVKLGRIKCLVSEIKLNGSLTSIKTSDFKLKVEKHYEVKEKLTGQCKFCFVDLETEDNFFVSPCNCKGSCQIVHLDCLKKWIESKLTCKQNALVVSYNFTKFQCEICKDPLPKFVIRDGNQHQLIHIKRPQTPYIILQSVQSEGEGNRSLYIVSRPNPGEFVKMGRGHQCEIRITDISVSRQHAKIHYENEKFVIMDNSSKFGTLIKLQKSLGIKTERVAVQIGRTVVTCTLKTESLAVEKRETPPGVGVSQSATLLSKKTYDYK